MTLRVVVKGGDDYREADAAESITPGHIISLNSSSKAVKQASSTIGRQVNVAIENTWTNSATIGGTANGPVRDVPYAVNDRVVYMPLENGDQFLGFVAAGAAAVALNAYVKIDPANAGCVLTATAGDKVVGIARQAVDNSGGASLARIRVECV